MIDPATLFADLDSIGLESWRHDLGQLLDERLKDGAHGHLAEWREILRQIDLDHSRDRLRDLLLKLKPWRKGPFDVGGVHIDAEWRSDLKWRRVCDRIEPLAGRNILDVGSGNGYYALCMLKAGAARVIGIDPTVLFVVQFEAIRKLTGTNKAHVLPLRLEELPPNCQAFDTPFSMGVLYHRRAPADHLAELRGTLRSGGELVLETLVLPGDDHEVLVPEDRYARMRNVWHVPTTPALIDWLLEAGFVNPRLIDVTPTTKEEQRSTEWMPFDSLAQALDRDEPSLTIEGYPAPRRAVVITNSPG
jgi:tRNA (mo5U34)-methyltransferase